MENMVEFKKAVDGFQQTLASVVEIGNTTADDVKSMKDENKVGAEKRQEHETAITDLKSKLAECEKFMLRKPTVSDEKGLSPDNVKRFNAIAKQEGRREVTGNDVELAKQAFDVLITKGREVGFTMLTDEQKSVVNTIIDPQGGYLVAPEYDQELINKKFEIQGILGLVDVKNTATGTLHQSIDYADYDSWEYLNELANTDPEEHEPNYKQVNWNATEQIYKFIVSRSELEDALINVETDIIGKAREGANRQTAAQILLGDGVNRPKGMLTYEDGKDWNKIEQIESTNSTAIGWEDVITLLPKALIGPYHNNAKLAMNRGTFFDLLSDKDGAGQFSIMNQINFFSGDGAGMFIMGKEVVFDSGLQNTSTGGNKAVVFGDFQQAYRYVQRVGFSLIMDDKTSGQNITYRLRRRNDGKLRMGDALKILKIKS
ncbi:MAG: phage major capsid protein [Chloroflexi bacterium]|nr:MAG: phage major capsid protein [Chloroflexota bacterium]